MSESNLEYPLGVASHSSSYERAAKSRSRYFVEKRFFDVAVTLLAAPFALLIVALCAMLIRLNGGKAFFSQPRRRKRRANLQSVEAANDGPGRRPEAWPSIWPPTLPQRPNGRQSRNLKRIHVSHGLANICANIPSMNCRSF